MVVDDSELQVERARHGEEEVEVHERADRRVEDLLDDRRAEHSGKGGAADQRHVHQQRDDGADVGRQEPVHRDSRGICGQDVAVAHASARIPGCEDEVPGEGGQQRLDRLEGQPGHDVADRDLGHRVPQPLEPVRSRRGRRGGRRRARRRCRRARARSSAARLCRERSWNGVTVLTVWWNALTERG